jgi:murein L,D-transpeptidase YcbB/YkuD
VIVGTKALPTPQFAATVTGVAFNPTWFVPASIVAESVGALLKNDPDAAKAKGYYLGEDGNVRQKPGPANALGQMKLLMPNPYSVFLHDTPGKTAFEKDARALSHGCIRVEDAVDFARGLVKGVLDDEAVDEILASKTPTEVALEKPMPVYVVYFTAVAAADGTATFYPDIYGLDAELLPAFGADAPPPSEKYEAMIDACPGAAPAAR